MKGKENEYKILNINEMEDSRYAFSIFTHIGRQAAVNAVNENKALGIPVTYLQDDWIVRRMPDGKVEHIRQVAKVPRKMKLRKGTVLHVKRAH